MINYAPAFAQIKIRNNKQRQTSKYCLATIGSAESMLKWAPWWTCYRIFTRELAPQWRFEEVLSAR